MSALPPLSEPPPNALRYAGAPGHVESYFFRANHPSRPLALWLKATLLAPLRGPAVAESWFTWFDGERDVTLSRRQTQPFAAARFTGDGARRFSVLAPNLGFTLEDRGSAHGTAPTEQGDVQFDLTWAKDEAATGAPLELLPWRALRVGPFPRSKLTTPYPSLRVSGEVQLPWGRELVSDWRGMQGHNWGREHTFEYAWGQCLFPADDAMVEGFSARVRVAGRVTPRLSALVVRRGGRTFRFDTLFDGWRQQAAVSADHWRVALRGGDGDVTLEMNAAGRPMVCLGYDNPDGARSYCFNSKLAEVTLTVRPRDAASFTCRSAHGGALELLRREPDPRFTVV
jgi:hypothetical protein